MVDMASVSGLLATIDIVPSPAEFLDDLRSKTLQSPEFSAFVLALISAVVVALFIRGMAKT